MTDHLVEVFTNESKLAQYEKKGNVYESFGWDDSAASPLSRYAHVSVYGEEVVTMAEERARQEVERRRKRFAATAYAAHCAEADDNGSKIPSVDSFVWGMSSGLHCEGGLADEIEHCVWMEEQEEAMPIRLCKVCSVTLMTDAMVANAGDFSELINNRRSSAGWFPGGAATDDEGVAGVDGNEYATYYTLCAAIVMDGGRWFLIDSEGYDYSRYIYLPASEPDMYEPELNMQRDRNAAVKAEKDRANEKKSERRLAEYDARVAKWAPVMTDVRQMLRDAEKARHAYYEEARTSGYRATKGSAADRAMKAAERKAHNAVRANILAMFRTAFPGIAFSCKKSNGYGEQWLVTWTDGPTLQEVKEATDVDLFTRYTKYFDGYDDSTNYVDAEFKEFADKYGDSNGSGVIAMERLGGDELAAMEETAKAAGVYVENADRLTMEQAGRIAESLGANVSEAQDLALRAYWLTSHDVVRLAWDSRSFYVHQEAAPAPSDERHEEAAREDNAAPAEGLQLVEIDGGVAVTGDEKTTYRNRREIKAHGARWNRDARQWQATEPEAVETLRAWFGMIEQQPSEGAEEEGQQATGDTPACAPSRGFFKLFMKNAVVVAVLLAAGLGAHAETDSNSSRQEAAKAVTVPDTIDIRRTQLGDVYSEYKPDGKPSYWMDVEMNDRLYLVHISAGELHKLQEDQQADVALVTLKSYTKVIVKK